ncbi:MAG: prenyltransferase [Anaerolineaceae bacterium]|nr:prenyltransferase [Anaerolineaceae bacterium]
MQNNQTTLAEAERSRAIRFIKYLLFSATIVPALVAGAMAFAEGRFALLPWVLASLGLLIGQAGGDYLYYYFTHYHSDSRDSHTKIFAGWRPLFTPGWIKPEHTLAAGIVCLGVDVLIGIYFYLQLGTMVLLLAAAGGAVAVFFTPLMLRGLKEPVVFITFGPLCLFGVYYVLTQNISASPLLVSLPIACLVTVVAYLKGARFKIENENGKEIVMRLDVRVIGGLLGTAYLSLLAGVLISVLSPWALLTFLTIPLAWDFTRKVLQKKTIADYLWLTVQAQLVFVAIGLLIAFSYLIQSGSPL